MATKRISIDVDEELKAKLDKILPWGTQTRVFKSLFILLLDACEKQGTGNVIGALLTNELDLFGEENADE